MIAAYLTAAGVVAATVETWEGPLDGGARAFDINTPERVIPWLATCVHETGRFQYYEENLNYNAQGLLRVWPSRFTPQQAADCARKPERIANRAYANRMGNGPESSGDGWRFRGRGPIQITGRNNYAAVSAALGVDAIGDPDALLQPATGARAAAWFWSENGCNELADAGDLQGIRKAVNGGSIGLEEFVAVVAAMRAV